MPIQSRRPEDEQPNPYLPAGPSPLVMEMFEGAHTGSTRPGVDDRQCYWIDGFYPVSPRKLRALPDVGTPITFPGNPTVAVFGAANLGTTPYLIAVFADGSIRAANTDTYAITTIAAAATIVAPSVLTVGISQYGTQYVQIVSSQPNGYFLWDGTTLFKAGGLGPEIDLTNPGQGYQSVPSVTVSGGSGSGAQLTAAIADGRVTAVTVANPGTGYKATDSISLVFSGGLSSGSGASLSAVMASSTGTGATLNATFVDAGIGSPDYQTIQSIAVTAGGSGYSPQVVITYSGNYYIYRFPSFSITVAGGAVQSVTVVDGGLFVKNIGTPPSVLPTLSFSDPGSFRVSSVTIVAAGTGYSQSATATGAGGSTPTVQATYDLTITGGSITAVTVTNGGTYAGTTPAPSISVVDTTTSAAATATLMPFGVSGTSVETYSGHVWVVMGNVITWSAPDSVVDFSTSNGGGTLTSGSSTVRDRYIKLLATNGFLYLAADSSVEYISGVQTSGSPPTTTFNIQNADPEVGSPWPGSVITFGRNIMMANSWGAHVVYGAAATKVSDDMDGVWPTSTVLGSFLPSAAKCTVFNKKIWLLLIPMVDIVSGAQVTKLMIWNGKYWWTSPQSITFTFIAGQEVDSVLTAWGTDGTRIYPLFQTAGTGFTKTVRSKLWFTPLDYRAVKSTNRLYGVAQYNSATSPNWSVTIDNENGSSPSYTLTPSSIAAVPSFRVFGPNPVVSQFGQMLGMTWSTTAADVSLISAMLQPEIATVQT